MKFIVAALLFAACADAASVNIAEASVGTTARGYLLNIGVPAAERRRKAEEEYLKSEASRIVGGVPAALGQYPWQAGLISDIVGITGNGICGASLISPTRLSTAAHCWHDGSNQAWRFTVVLGSVLLFSGGHRVETSAVVMHPNWTPSLIRYDVAVIYLASPVPISNNIAPVALPVGPELNELFNGETAIASGFGITADGTGIGANQFLSHVSLSVITNGVCSFAFPFIVQPSNICTSGVGGVGTCGGDSGGPLTVVRNNRRILIGITSFGSALGCQANLPAAFARVTSFVDFFNQHL